MLWLVRVPLKLMPFAEVRALTPAKAGRLLATPSPRAASAVTLRPLVANWVTCWPVMRVLRSLVSVCTWRASAWTVTVCPVPPTVSEMSSRRVWSTFTVMSVLVYFSKPAAAALREKRPTFKLGKM